MLRPPTSQTAASLFAHYELDSSFDEMFAPGHRPRDAYRLLFDRLLELPATEWRHRQQAADRAFLNQGVTFTVYGNDEGTERIFPYDILPRIITGAEWQPQGTDTAGWSYGRVLLPDLSGARAYDVSYSDASGAEDIEVRIAPPQGGESSATFRIPSGVINGPNASIIIIIIVVVLSCALAQLIATSACGLAARMECTAKGGVKSSYFAGVCGAGRCKVECYGPSER